MEMKKLLWLAVMATALGLVGVTMSEEPLPQNQTGGEVEVTAEPKQLIVGKEMVFAVSLNTHTVELDEDMARIVRVSDDRGREYRVVSWSGGKGGHHLSGELRVAALQKGAGRIKLTIGGKIGKEVSFDETG